MVLADLMSTKLTRIVNWLTKSGMKVNEAKTSLCLFSNHDTAPIEITVHNSVIKSSKTMNVLGVVFDQKLQWGDQINHCTSKANNAITAIRMIKKYFTTKELLQLVTSNVFSTLYYNSEIWHLHSLKGTLKQKLLSTSAKAIKMCVKYCTNDVSFYELHKKFNRATPENYLLYKHALALFKLLTNENFTTEWVALNFNQILTSRQTLFMSLRANKRKVGLNALANRAFILNNRIPLTWFSMSIDTFKIHCKRELLDLNN